MSMRPMRKPGDPKATACKAPKISTMQKWADQKELST